MSAELERSQFARETLGERHPGIFYPPVWLMSSKENSTKDLATLSESYSNLDTLLSSSRSLVSSLIHSQKSDTWYLESAFYILAATIAWLVFRRLIYGPGWWLLYLPTKWLWRLSLFAVQLLVGSLSAVAGTVGAKNQSSALSHASEGIATSLAQKPTGTGKIPTFRPNSPAPSVKVGAGGQGAKMQQPEQPEQPSQEKDKSLSDEVGEMAEQSQKEQHIQPEKIVHTEGEGQGTVLRERREDEPPNPKKRVWEEPIDRSQGKAPRDEL